jgi:hypothetical protein
MSVRLVVTIRTRPGREAELAVACRGRRAEGAGEREGCQYRRTR